MVPENQRRRGRPAGKNFSIKRSIYLDERSSTDLEELKKELRVGDSQVLRQALGALQRERRALRA